jgi:CCR4-NOT transcription complex subunit 4
MNGLCPACRRPYDDENIQYKPVSAEQMAQHKQNLAQQAKKKAAARQKEAQKREADHLSRKHLAGLRVRQKNLVYVTGLRPIALGERLVERLRQRDMFGQYGDIVKVVVAKSKDTGQPQQQRRAQGRRCCLHKFHRWPSHCRWLAPASPVRHHQILLRLPSQ